MFWKVCFRADVWGNKDMTVAPGGLSGSNSLIAMRTSYARRLGTVSVEYPVCEGEVNVADGLRICIGRFRAVWAGYPRSFVGWIEQCRLRARHRREKKKKTTRADSIRFRFARALDGVFLVGPRATTTARNPATKHVKFAPARSCFGRRDVALPTVVALLRTVFNPIPRN